MAKLKKLCILLGVLAAVCIATIIVSNHEIKKEKIKNSDEVILEVPSDTVSSLSWTYDGNTLSFTKQDDTWSYDADPTLPVDPDKIDQLLKLFEEFGVSFVIEEPESLDQYGLDKPECTVSFTADGKDHTLKLGGFSTMDSERYVSIDDGNVYLVKTDPLDAFDKTADDFIKSDEVPELSSAEKISIGGSSVQAFDISYDADNELSYSDEDVYYCGGTPLDSESVSDYLNAVSSVSLDSCIDHSFTDDRLSDYGLDKPYLTVSISYDKTDENGKKTAETGDISFAIGIDPKDTSKLAASDGNTSGDKPQSASSAASDDSKTGSNSDSGLAAPDETDADSTEDSIRAYIRFNDSKLVCSLSQDDFDRLTAAKLKDFSKKDLLPVSFDDVEGIDAELDGEHYTFTGDRRLTGGRDWRFDGESIDISDIQSAVEAASYDDISDTEATLKKEIGLSFKTTNKHHPVIGIDIYRYNGSDCIAVSDSGSSMLIPRSKVMALTEAIYAIVLG